jgi:hypothetical protein
MSTELMFPGESWHLLSCLGYVSYEQTVLQVQQNSFEAWIFSKVFLLDNELIFGISHFLKLSRFGGLISENQLYIWSGVNILASLKEAPMS